MTDRHTDAAASRWRAYGDVDGAPEARSLGGYLDELAAVSAIALEKRRSLELLRLGPGDACLDVGCGLGPELDSLAAIVGVAGRVVGLDRSATLIERARRRRAAGAPIELVAGDAQGLPFADAAFDGCRADRTLQHVKEPERALAEMARVTRSGGRVVVTELRWGLVAPGLDPVVTQTVLGQLATAGDRMRWLGERLPALMEGAGLAAVEPRQHDHTMDGYDDIARVLNLRWTLPAAIAAGAVAAADAAAWTARLRVLAEQGEALVALIVVHVAGTRP